VRRDQWLNIGLLLPAVFLINLICAYLIRSWPEFFLERNGHFWLVAVRFLGLAIYILYVVRFFVDLAPLIAPARHEWQTRFSERNSS
jgi:hypothetical protein